MDLDVLTRRYRGRGSSRRPGRLGTGAMEVWANDTGRAYPQNFVFHDSPLVRRPDRRGVADAFSGGGGSPGDEEAHADASRVVRWLRLRSAGRPGRDGGTAHPLPGMWEDAGIPPWGLMPILQCQ